MEFSCRVLSGMYLGVSSRHLVDVCIHESEIQKECLVSSVQSFVLCVYLI